MSEKNVTPVARTITLWGVVVLVGVIAVMIFYSFFKPSPSLLANFGAPFTLASSKGGMVRSEDLLGKPYGIFFGFTHCPEVCPTTMYEMSKALEQLGPEAKDFRLFFISIDPERDTVEAMRDYVSNFDPRIEALIPTLQELPALAKAYRVYYAKIPGSDENYNMDHTATVFLMDRKGKLEDVISYEDKPEVRLQKLKKLLAP